MAHGAARRWGSSGSISQLASLAATPAPPAHDPGFRDPSPGHWVAEASPLRRHSTQAEPTLQRPPSPGDASLPAWQRLPQVCLLIGAVSEQHFTKLSWSISMCDNRLLLRRLYNSACPGAANRTLQSWPALLCGYKPNMAS